MDRARYHELKPETLEKMRYEARNITPTYEEEYQAMFDKADVDGDGKLNCQEFVKFLNMRDEYNLERYGGTISWPDEGHEEAYQYFT